MARTINRVFQGVGAAGTYSLAVVILFEMVPPSKYAAYSGASVAVVSVANALGPVVGGLINNDCSWRWAFLFMWAPPAPPDRFGSMLTV